MSKDEQNMVPLPPTLPEKCLSFDESMGRLSKGRDSNFGRSSLMSSQSRLSSQKSPDCRPSHSYSGAMILTGDCTTPTQRKWTTRDNDKQSSLSKIMEGYVNRNQGDVPKVSPHFRTISTITVSPEVPVNAIGWNYQTVNRFPAEKIQLAAVNGDGSLKIYEPASQWGFNHMPLIEEKIECENDNVVEFDVSGHLVANAGSTSDIIVQNLKDMQYPLTLVGHDSPCTDLRFPEQDKLLSSSRDSNVYLWDIHKERVEMDFREHSAIVNALDVNPINPELFATGGSDLRTKFWDRRTAKSVSSWLENTNEVTGVQYFRNGYNLITSSADCTCNLLCLRSGKVLQVYEDGQCTGGFSSVQLSNSGRYLFATHYQKLVVFDVLTAKVLDIVDLESKITCMKLSPDHMALACSLNDGSIDFIAIGPSI